MAKSSDSDTGAGDTDLRPEMLEPGPESVSVSAEQKLEADRGAVISIDVDGPVTNHGDGVNLDGRTQEQVAEALGCLAEVSANNEDIDVVLNSGNPLAYLEHVVEEFSEYDDRIEEHGLDLIGGMGTEYRIEGDETFLDVEKKPMVETQKEIYAEAANQGWSLNVQNNQTGAVWVNRIESEEETETNPTFNGEKNTEDLWEDYLREEEGFEFVENYERRMSVGEETGAVIFDEEEGTETLLELQRQHEDFIGLRFERNSEGEIVFYRQEEDREVDYDEAFGRMADIVEASKYDWKHNNYDDGGFEVWDPEFCGKGEGLDVYRFAKGLGSRDSMHLGDSSSSDYVEAVNSYIIPQEGTDAERDTDEIKQERVMETKRDVVDLADSIKNSIDSQSYAQG